MLRLVKSQVFHLFVKFLMLGNKRLFEGLDGWYLKRIYVDEIILGLIVKTASVITFLHRILNIVPRSKQKLTATWQ